MNTQPTSVLDSNCECQNWARVFDAKHLTAHHPECSHYNDSLIDVWRVAHDGAWFLSDTEPNAEEFADCTITKERMHREVYDHLPEFEGF